MPSGRAAACAALAAVLVASLTACGDQPDAPGASKASQADGRAWLDRYEKVFTSAVPGRPLVQVGSWSRVSGQGSASARAAAADALSVGAIQRAARLPEDVPAAGTATWADGTTSVIDVLTAADALQQAVLEGRLSAAPGPMHFTPPLRVVGAQLTTMTVDSTHGAARVPAWRLTLQHSTLSVLRVAAATQPVVNLPPPVDLDDRAHPYATSGTLAADGRALSVQFTGSPRRQSEECGADYTGRPLISAHAVVVLITEHPHVGGTAQDCDASGMERTATVELDQPMGDRSLLGGQHGDPVPLTRPAT